MIRDKLLEFDPDTAITVTRDSANVLDMLAQRDMGVGQSAGATPKLSCIVGTAFTAAGAATLVISLQGSVDNVTYKEFARSEAIPVASLIAGLSAFDIDLPRPAPDAGGIPRYYKLVYTVATGPMTAGTMQSAIVLERGDYPQQVGGYVGGYPSGFTVAN